MPPGPLPQRVLHLLAGELVRRRHGDLLLRQLVAHVAVGVVATNQGTDADEQQHDAEDLGQDTVDDESHDWSLPSALRVTPYGHPDIDERYTVESEQIEAGSQLLVTRPQTP